MNEKFSIFHQKANKLLNFLFYEIEPLEVRCNLITMKLLTPTQSSTKVMGINNRIALAQL